MSDAPPGRSERDAGPSPVGLRLRGVRTHNLRGFDLALPPSSLVVVTGPSGSGKSSLAFDTVHAESRSRFASATREFDLANGGINPPDLDSAIGLGVTIGLSQRAVVRSIRSTVATMAGVAEPIRRVFAATAVPGCPRCGGVGVRHEVRDAVAELAALPEGARITILAHVADGELGDAKQTVASLIRAGFVRGRFDGEIRALAEYEPAIIAGGRARAKISIDAVVDRLAIRDVDRDRLREAVELAYRTSDGSAIAAIEGTEERRYSRRPVCGTCGAPLEALDPSAFRRTDARAACSTCAGAGVIEVAETKRRRGRGRSGAVDDEEDRAVESTHECASCQGLGLGTAALDARALGVSYRALHTRSASELATLLSPAPEDAREPGPRSRQRLVLPALESLRAVLRFLIDVGLGHVTLGRRAPSLSNGELSRVRLAGLLANELVGVTYVLDEPTAGLHPLERPAIIRALRHLVDLGNSVISVEHDRDLVASADFVVELGPGAGKDGGSLMVAAPIDELPRAV